MQHSRKKQNTNFKCTLFERPCPSSFEGACTLSPALIRLTFLSLAALHLGKQTEHRRHHSRYQKADASLQSIDSSHQSIFRALTKELTLTTTAGGYL